VIAALSRTNGRDAAPSIDTIEFVSEAFDRELLYLIAVFDGYGRAFMRWLDPTGGDVRKSLHSAKTLEDHVDPNYPGAPQLDRIRELQRFAFTSQLRNRIHEAVLATGSFMNRTYGSAQAIAIDLDQTVVELTQELDRLGIWQATPPNSTFGQPTTVADVATTAVALFTAGVEYVNLFTHLIMCTRPVNAPNAEELLGKVTDTGFRPAHPHPTQALYHRLSAGTIDDSCAKDVCVTTRRACRCGCWPARIAGRATFVGQDKRGGHVIAANPAKVEQSRTRVVSGQAVARAH
jgi:hypothetical protein